MNAETDFEYLRLSPLTHGLTDDQVKSLISISLCRQLEDQEVLISEGHVDNALHIVVHGALAVTRDMGRGEFTTIHVLRTGDLAGEMGFISGRPHTATLRALGTLQICTIEREAFEGLLPQDPWLVYRVMCNIVQVGQDILRRMNAQYVELTKYVHRAHAVY